MPSPLDRLSPERRAELVRHAADEFASAGFAQASLNRIVRACGMSKSSFYHLFDSKQDLMNFVVADLADQVRRALEVPEPDVFAGDFWPLLQQFVTHLEDRLAEQPDGFLLGRLFYAEPGPIREGDARAGVFAEISGWVAAVLRVGRGVGAVRTDLPVELQQALVVAMLRTMDEWAVRTLAADAGRHRDGPGSPILLDVLRRMLAP